MSRAPARFTQADLNRALKAAEKAGPDVAVDILPDGTIRLSRQQKDERDKLGLRPGLVL